jgi:hypothetical protein
MHAILDTGATQQAFNLGDSAIGEHGLTTRYDKGALCGNRLQESQGTITGHDGSSVETKFFHSHIEFQLYKQNANKLAAVQFIKVNDRHERAPNHLGWAPD